MRSYQQRPTNGDSGKGSIGRGPKRYILRKGAISGGQQKRPHKEEPSAEVNKRGLTKRSHQRRPKKRPHKEESSAVGKKERPKTKTLQRGAIMRTTKKGSQNRRPLKGKPSAVAKKGREAKQVGSQKGAIRRGGQ